MTDMMLAERFYKATKEVKVEEIPIPEPGPGEVRVKIEYCGICHSDIFLIQGVFPTSFDVITQGHESVGIIDKLGEGVTGWSVGERVIPGSLRPCGECRRCRLGDTANCLNWKTMAFEYDGAWAQYHIARTQGLTRVPDGIDPKQAALLVDAVATPYSAVVHTGQVHLGNAVAVWGVGGVGTHVMMLAKLAGAAPLIAIDLNDEVLQRAKELGADYTFRSDDPDLTQKVIDATGGRMVDVAFDVVGIPATTEAASAVLDNKGKIVVIGMNGGPIHAGPNIDFTARMKSVLGHYGAQVADVGVILDLMKLGDLDLSRSVSGIVSLKDIQKGIDWLESKEGNPIRILVDPWMD